MYGTTGEPSKGGRHESPFYDPHSGFSFFFNGMPSQDSWTKPGQINHRSYYKAVLPESYEKPYLIEIISDWCFACKLVTFLLQLISETHGCLPDSVITFSPELAFLLRSGKNAAWEGNTPLFGLYRHVRPQRVGFSATLVINKVSIWPF